LELLVFTKKNVKLFIVHSLLEPPRKGGEQMKKSDNNYLSSNYKETKMMVKITAGFRHNSP